MMRRMSGYYNRVELFQILPTIDLIFQNANSLTC